jgi:hypothetical protein
MERARRHKKGTDSAIGVVSRRTEHRDRRSVPPAMAQTQIGTSRGAPIWSGDTPKSDS